MLSEIFTCIALNARKPYMHGLISALLESNISKRYFRCFRVILCLDKLKVLYSSFKNILIYPVQHNMKEKIVSKRQNLRVCLGSVVNTLLFLTIIILQVIVIWNVGIMFFGSEDSNSEKKELTEEQQIEKMRKNTASMNKNVFNERRFEVEVVQPHQEMLEKFSKHPNLVFNKLSKTIQKEDQR